MKVQGAIFVTLKSGWALTSLTLLHSEIPKLYTILAFLSAVGLKFYSKVFLCDGQGAVMGAILHVDRSCFQRDRK